jgi:ABC-type siderophore export system fused ATPase/permease subunit
MATAIRQARWPRFLLAFAGIMTLFWTAAHKAAGTAPATVPGWDGVLPCSYAASIDGTKELMLNENHSVTLYDERNPKDGTEQDQNKIIDGEWSFDEALKRYAITLNGATTVYSVVQPENSHTCLLVKGGLNSANLRESWFSLNLEDLDDTRERYER